MIMAVLLGSVAWQGSNAVFNQKAKPYVVVIDPGHGGYDPGAVAAQAVYEKEITLQVSRRLQALLSGDGVKAVLTRDEDEDYVSDGVSGRKNKKRSDLDYRINMAAGIQADIFVSLHVNAVAKGNNSGAETFYYNLSAEGKRLAEAIQNELIGIPGMNRRVAKPGDYYVVKNTKMPAVIVELGYLSNSAERNKLQREDYQEELAVAIARGIARYFDAR
jgi:N-acetylmuramoyl-L-alanine amidase